jgi:glutamine amidotransferase
MGDKNIVIIDYQLGNISSIRQACEYVNMKASLSSNEKHIMNADGIILPGVGAFGEAMEKLKKKNLDDIINNFIKTGKPLLGICLGMQLLFETSLEFGVHKGLGILPGKVLPLDEHASNNRDLINCKIPQMGWNRIKLAKRKYNDQATMQLFKGMSAEPYMYFVHSFYAKPDDEDIVLTYSSYNGIRYCSMLKSRNIIACQFHPEKSATDGLAFFRNFSEFAGV